MNQPRLTLIGPNCGSCQTPIKTGNVLMRVQYMGYNGYLHTEICIVCIIKENKDEILKILAKDQPQDGKL